MAPKAKAPNPKALSLLRSKSQIFSDSVADAAAPPGPADATFEEFQDVVPEYLKQCITVFETLVAPMNPNERNKINKSCKMTESNFAAVGPLRMCSYSRMSVPGVYPFRGAVAVSG